MKQELINYDWNFKDLQDGTSCVVTLPHTVKTEDLNVYNNYKGKFEYTKKIVIPDYDKDLEYYIYFEGVMINCEVFINEKKVIEHFGGYLPFIIDVTEYGKQFNIKVVVDNNDDKNTPPGKPTEGLDFLYYGGIYRNVKLLTKSKLHITNCMQGENSGVKILPRMVNDHVFELLTSIQIANHYSNDKFITVKFTVKDNEKIIDSHSIDKALHANSLFMFKEKIEIIGVQPWELDNPKIYDIVIELYLDNLVVCKEVIPYGFRIASVDNRGLLLNGKRVKLFGVNRHHQFPYIGIAASDNAQRREARLLRESGVNILRLAHYPQSEAFLDECDRLGMVVIDCVPGWQYIGGKLWQDRLKENVIDMVRRDRNHASVIIYEVTPNESMYVSRKGDAFIKSLKDAAKQELECCLTAGDTAGRFNARKVDLDIPYVGEDALRWLRKTFKREEKSLLKREHGDWSFGGNKSTSRVSRGDGEFAMQLQSWNFQWSKNISYEQDNLMGDLLWEGIDHNRGYYPKAPISKSGIYDIFRLPKISQKFVLSQFSPKRVGYVLEPAVHMAEGKKLICVYSNCDEIALLYNGKEIKRQKPDNGKTQPYTSKTEVINEYYWKTYKDHIAISNMPCGLSKQMCKTIFNGGNCENLEYPPFTIKLDSFNSDTVIEFVGYAKNKQVIKKTVPITIDKANKIDIEVAEKGIDLVANDNDFVFVYAKAINKDGLIDINYNEGLKAQIAGGRIIGYNDFEAGIASFLVAATSESVELTVNSSQLSTKCIIKAKK